MAEKAHLGKRKLEEESSVNAGCKAVEDYDSRKFEEKSSVNGGSKAVEDYDSQKLEEESSVNGGSKAAEEYDSDEYDHDMYVGNRRMNREIRKEYWRQVEESEGFDITLDLDLGGVSIGAPIVPSRADANDPEFTEISCLAIDAFNSQNNTRYKFVKNVTVTTSLAAGFWCRNTFLAKDSDAPCPEKTFQALGFWGICGERDIVFCRLKKTSSDQGDEYPPYYNVDFKAPQ